VVILDRRPEPAEAKAEELRQGGADAIAIVGDVLDETEMRATRDEVVRRWGRVDILMNAAGGNIARSRNDDRSIFEVPMDAFDEVLRLNLHGSVVPSLAFGEAMARQGSGSIVNISSMAAMRALSGTLGYSVAKSGIDIFTKWLAFDLARKYGGGIRVNAIAPGFFIGEQNRALLVGPDGSFTARGQTIIGHTPMGRFGKAEEVVGAVVWLCSDAASFVTGVIIPIDGGFSSFTGV
jgi:NAD(P)-dependent dehydrogenase (short-subunit alcohol dehydrogenase family)